LLKIAYSPTYKLGLPPNHRFPMAKYELIPEQLLYEGTITQANLFAPAFIEESVILATHDEGYWIRMKNLALTPKEMRAIGFPMSQALVDRCLTISEGTIQCAHYAMQYGVAMNCAGGTHHAFTDRGEGFCLINDVGVTANYLLKQGLVKKVLVVDLDVHQGNGTAQIFQNEPRVFTFSMHGANNYPIRKEQSDLDIGLPDFANDDYYLPLLDRNLKYLIDTVQPDIIFFNSGVDVLLTDKLGRLGMSLEGCKKRDRMVFETAKSYKIPVVVSMGGGYSESLATIVEAHANTFRSAQDLFF
jgi:acetoin utilization deacetylase AcuC-like enzyme